MSIQKRLLEQKVYDKWMPKLDVKFAQLGIKESIKESRKRTIALMAHARQIHESAPSYAFGSPSNTPGRGAYIAGNNPQDGVSGFYDTTQRGSGEVTQNLFDVFVEVAASCIAFDMFPTIPMSKSSGSIYIAEPIYAGGKLDNGENKPLVIQVKLVKTGTPTALAAGTQYTIKTANSGGENVALVTYLGKHRINGNAIFKIDTQYDNSGSAGTNWQEEVVAEMFNTTSTGNAIYQSSGNHWDFDETTVNFVEGFVNRIGGFSGAGINDDNAWFIGRGNGKNYTRPMSRKTGESSYYRNLGLRTWHKNYSAETLHCDLNYTTEQIQDMENDHGMDAREFGNSVLQDQLTQDINDHLLGRFFALGWQHHYNMNQQSGFNMNAFISSASNTGTSHTFLGADDTSLTIAGAPGVLPSSGAISENLSTLQRRIVTRLLFGSGVINNRSRRGRGDMAAMNTTFSTAMQDIRGFQPATFPNDINTGNAYYIGSLYNIGIYEDPLMDLADERVSIGRKGGEKDPGIKFCPYILAEKITTIAEQTMAPKDALKSRYAVVEAGTYPELNYLTFTVEQDAGYKLV